MDTKIVNGLPGIHPAHIAARSHRPKKQKKTKSPSFVMLEKRELLGSLAWKELSGSAVKVYIFLRSKAVGNLHDRKNYCTLQKDIKIPYSIIQKDTGLARQTVRDAIIELENKGFIDLHEQGGLKSGGYTMNTYRLSIRFTKWGQPDFEAGTMCKAKNVTDRGFGKWRQKQKASTETRPALV